MKTETAQRPMPDTKRKLLDSAMHLMIRQGYTATTVDQVCCDAGLTKGSFFHYFKSKEQIGEAAIDYFSCCRRDAFAKGAFNSLEESLDVDEEPEGTLSDEEIEAFFDDGAGDAGEDWDDIDYFDFDEAEDLADEENDNYDETPS